MLDRKGTPIQVGDYVWYYSPSDPRCLGEYVKVDGLTRTLVKLRWWPDGFGKFLGQPAVTYVTPWDCEVVQADRPITMPELQKHLDRLTYDFYSFGAKMDSNK